MTSYTYARAFQAALIGIAMTGSATLARADIKDYEFQLVDQTVKNGDAIISVRLVTLLYVVRYEPHPDNESALGRVARLSETVKLFMPLIMEEDGTVIWSGPDFLRECDARKVRMARDAGLMRDRSLPAGFLEGPPK
jgi:hypothetical protein